jgi:hypothetical protein
VNDLDRMLFLRAGGAVSRAHQIPMIDRQTNAAHSWGVAILIDELNQDWSRPLLRAALHHDICEGTVGDIPAHVGWRWPDLKREVKKAEQEVNDLFGLMQNLSEADGWWLAGCDLLELAFTCYDQLRLGNRNFLAVWGRVQGRFLEMAGLFPAPVIASYGQLVLRSEYERLV